MLREAMVMVMEAAPCPGASCSLLLFEGRTVEPSGGWTLEALDPCPDFKVLEFALFYPS